MKSNLLESLAIFLLKDGFTVKTLTRSCFDLLARKKDLIILIKALEDANAVMESHVQEMDKVSSYMAATPLIVAEKAGSLLENNVIYSRFGMTTLNVTTFINCVRSKYPLVRRTQAGLTISISGNRLKEKREAFGYSLNALSKKVGVTSRMIAKYETGNAEITIQKAKKLHDIFGTQVFEEINIFTRIHNAPASHGSKIVMKYVQLGFDASDTHNTPFDIIAKKGHELILTEVGDKQRPDLSSLSRLLDADKLVIFRRKRPKDVPALTQQEFLEFQEANKLIKFLKEF